MDKALVYGTGVIITLFSHNKEEKIIQQIQSR
jgi:hypothetical protein